ncbi:MAG: CTB family bacteriocin [Dolichospermum sp. BR01]|nr:CTB family bacteriocin [Dolichospermum sp. BR01]
MSNLFTAVSVEQQEMVAGGVIALQVAGTENLLYSADQFTLQNNANVGPNGIITATGIANTSITSNALRALAITPVSFAL